MLIIWQKIKLHHRVLPWLLAMISAILLLPAAVFAAKLQQVRILSTPQQTQTVLQLDDTVRFSSHSLPAMDSRKERFYVDLYATRAALNVDKKTTVADRHIDTVRVGEHGTTTRVVVDLNAGQACGAQAQSAQHQIVINCRSKEDGEKVEGGEKVSHEKVASLAAPSSGQQSNTAKISATDAEGNSGLSDKSATSLQESSLFAAAPAADQLEMPSLSLEPDKPFSVGGQIIGYSAYDVNRQDNEDQRLSRVRSCLWLQHDRPWLDNLTLHGRASVEWDVIDSDDDYADNDNDVSLYEGYVKLSGDSWDLSMGRQRVRWGKSDQLSPLDSINPDDMRQFITVDLEERKIPSWLARLRVYLSRVTVETIFMPWFEEPEIDYFDSDWALYRNLRQSIADNAQLPLPVRNYAANMRVHERQPSDSLAHMSGALRLSWQGDNSDYAVSYRYGWASMPTITSFPVKNISFNGDPDSNPAGFLSNAVLTNQPVEACFKRQRIAGFEWESVFDPVGFRGEIAYVDHVPLLSSDLTSQDKKVVHLVSGIDYTSVDDWYINVQTSWYRIFAYNSRILYFEQDNVALLGELRKTVWRGNLELSTRYNYTVTDGSSYLQPAVTLKYFSNVEAQVGVVVFSGSGDTLFGSYGNADQYYGKIKLSF